MEEQEKIVCANHELHDKQQRLEKKTLHVLSHDPNERLLENFKIKNQAIKHQKEAEQTQFPMTKHNTYFHRTFKTCASRKAMKGLMFPLI